MRIQQNKHLREISTFGIGGPARYFLEVYSIQEMQEALLYCSKENLRFMVVGKGSNCLFDDQGFNGMIIQNKIAFIERPEPHIYHVGAGYSFSLLGTQTAREGFTGLEFASGIPGTVGGAVFMNAGANGRESADSILSVDFVTEKGEQQLFTKEQMQFSYRSSLFQSVPGAIVAATFHLIPSESARTKQLEIINYRKKTQPYSDKSAGCIFRNPSCGHAGALIEQSGLKGTRVGEAKVSEIHANFIVNAGHASSKEVLELIKLVQEQVKIKCNIELESEVRYIPYES